MMNYSKIGDLFLYIKGNPLHSFCLSEMLSLCPVIQWHISNLTWCMLLSTGPNTPLCFFFNPAVHLSKQILLHYNIFTI